MQHDLFPDYAQGMFQAVAATGRRGWQLPVVRLICDEASCNLLCMTLLMERRTVATVHVVWCCPAKDARLGTEVLHRATSNARKRMHAHLLEPAKSVRMAVQAATVYAAHMVVWSPSADLSNAVAVQHVRGCACGLADLSTVCYRKTVKLPSPAMHISSEWQLDAAAGPAPSASCPASCPPAC
jgi:hypothetical protein